VPSLPAEITLPATFSFAEARRAGYSKHAIYRLRDAGLIEVLSRGLYRLASADVLDLDLVEVVHKAPQATLCLVSALSRHGLTDEIADRTHLALPRRTRPPAVRATVGWHQFERATFEVGRALMQLDQGARIGLYSPERSIVDAFRLRGREGHELANEALKRWLRQRNQPAVLLRVAKQFPRTVTPIRKALELLL
jgi:predicted transcriptional regulator of viral defense system